MAEDPFFPEQFVSWREITLAEVSKFENSLNAARNEADLQRFLEENPLALMLQIGGGLGAWVISQARLGAEHVTDFLIAKESSVGYAWYAVELERPHAKMFNKNGDVSKDLNHALRQIGDWRDWLTNNLDYARRSRNKSGLNLTDIDPELQGLIIIGRDADVDRSTDERRRRMNRENRTRIETYDWLISQARKSSSASPKTAGDGSSDIFSDLAASILANPRPEESAKKAVRKVFGGIWSTYTPVSATRTIDWSGVDLGSEDPNQLVALEVVYARGRDEDKLLQPHDWDDWTKNFVDVLECSHSLLVTEREPAEELLSSLTAAQQGVWYFSEGQYTWFKVNVLVYLPPSISYEEKIGRVTVAQNVLLRSTPESAHELELEREQRRKVEIRARSISLAAGDSVVHDKFGQGTVVSTSGAGAESEATVDFGEKFGVKTLVLGYAPLKKI